jgi:hypothetical protein
MLMASNRGVSRVDPSANKGTAYDDGSPCDYVRNLGQPHCGASVCRRDQGTAADGKHSVTTGHEHQQRQFAVFFFGVE